MCETCDNKEKRELLLEKLRDDYRDELRYNDFMAWKDRQDMRSLYVEYLNELDGFDFHELINHDDFKDWLKERWENGGN